MAFPSEATLDRAHGPKPRSRSGTAGVLGLEYRGFWGTSVFLLTRTRIYYINHRQNWELRSPELVDRRVGQVRVRVLAGGHV